MTKRFFIAGGLIAIFGLAVFGCIYHLNRDGPSPAPEGGSAQDAEAGPLTADEAERRAAAVFDRVTSAFVKAEHESGRHLGGEAAVIVSADGHVVYRAFSRGRNKNFILADGRRVTGTHLGWSWEWGIGLVKLDGPGPWPHVELAPSDVVKAGQWVFTLGYLRREPEQPKPLLKVEGVTGSAVGRWFVLNDGGKTAVLNTPAAFDLDGRLVGVGWNPYLDVTIGTVYTDAKVIRDFWKDLAAGKNMDDVRLRGDDKGGAERDSPAKSVTPKVEAAVKAASVRIRMTKKDRGWSGTIVTPDGVVATCAHGLTMNFVTPGTKVIVCLPDGRDAVGELVGYNHVMDVCMVKITDKGPWPHVEMGDSTRMRPGDPCVMFGYGPGNDNARQPFLRRTTFAKQWESHWSFNLDIDPKIKWHGGDSGGGVFDADGRLVAFFLGGRTPGDPQIGRRVEVFKAHRDEMSGPYERADAPAAAVKAGG